jgi:hypothetical protein
MHHCFAFKSLYSEYQIELDLDLPDWKRDALCIWKDQLGTAVATLDSMNCGVALAGDLFLQELQEQAGVKNIYTHAPTGLPGPSRTRMEGWKEWRRSE